MSRPPRLGWFEAVGIELEYAIVDAHSLDVRPVADWLLSAQAGELTSEAPCGELAWCNELALHALEMKTLTPAKWVGDVVSAMRTSVERANRLLEQIGARLLPGGMHPWMDPRSELSLWPHEGAEIYETFDRTFDCRRHGFANVQSQQINLPFRDDAEWGRLHAAIRIVLPILPALAASSPIEAGRPSGRLDGRLFHYARLTPQAPSLGGRVIPEAVFTEAGYRRDVLEPIQADLERLGVADVMVAEWCNGRGAIPRFDRSAFEIRLLDTQECPEADLAVAAAVVAVVRWVAETVPSFEQRCFTAESLARILEDVVEDGEDARVDDVRYLRALGLETVTHASARKIWAHLLATVVAKQPDFRVHRPWLTRILEEGCLARRILARTGRGPDRTRLRDVYAELCECLATGKGFPGRR